jgi:hypothetical protein
MSIKRRRTTITMAGATASVDLGLGAPYGKVFKVEIKGDDADVDINATFAITDAEGRKVLAATAVDAGTDDSTALTTSQDFSTVGVGFYLGPIESTIYDAGGDPSADTEGVAPGMVAKSPVTIDVAAGTATDVYEVTLFVEV